MGKTGFLKTKILHNIFDFAIRFLTSIVVSVGVPVVCFLIFISFQPREIIKVDNYLKQRLKQIKNINISYSKSMITSSRLTRVRLIIDGVKISGENFYIEIPLITIDTKLLNLFKKRQIIDNIYFKDAIVKITKIDNFLQQKNSQNQQNTNNNLENDKLKFIGDIIDKYKDYLIVKTIAIDNLNFFENNKNLIIDDLLLGTKLYNNKMTLNLNISGILNDKNNSEFKIKNSCNYIFTNRNVNCVVDVLDLSFADVINLISNKIDNENINKYNDKFFGDFTFKLLFDIDNFKTINNLKFFILADNGEFELKELFDEKVFFKNFNISGFIGNNGEIIDINKSYIDLYTSKDSDRFNHFEFNVLTKKNSDITLQILSNKIYVEDLRILWPKILNSKADIRKWVINAVKLGTVENVDTKLIFSKNNITNEYLLTVVDAVFDLNGNTLNYDNSFPTINNIVGKAKFTKDDMEINIDTAESESSLLKNGRVFLNFDKLDLFIKANILGQTHDLGHYIDYLNKKKIEKNLDEYVKGKADTTVDIILPLNNTKTMFANSEIFINSKLNIEDNFIFSNGSKVILDMKKYKKSNTFNTTIDIKGSTIDYQTFNFMKNKDQPVKLYLDIVIDNKFVLLDNMKVVDGDLLSLNGRGIIFNGMLQSLNINNIKYQDMNLDVFIKSKNNDFVIDVLSNKIVLNLNSKQNNSNKKAKTNDFTFDNLLNSNVVFTGKVDNVIISNNYMFTNLNLYALYYDKKLKKSDITMFDITNNEIKYNMEYKDDKKHNIFNLNIMNIGDLLKNMSITDKIKGGNLEIKGNYKNKIAKITLTVKNDFDIFYDNNNVLIKSLSESKLVSKKIKKKLNRTVFKYKTLKSELNYDFNNSVLDIKRFLFDSKNFFTGLDISGIGNVNTSTGEIKLTGAVIPLSMINSLFGTNKIPILNKVLFNDKDGGLFVVGFEFVKKNFQDELSIKISKYDTFVNSAKSTSLLFLLFLL